MDSPKAESSKPEGMDDPLLSPLFLSAGEDTSTSSSSNSSSQHSDSPRNDWMLPGSMWNQFSDPKPPALDDLNFPSILSQDQWPMDMDMDVDISAFMSDSSHNFSIDPNALHFEGTVFDQSKEQMPAATNYDSMFQFTLSQPPDATPGPSVPLQLPTPNPGSTSSRSVSPALTKSDQDSSVGVNPSDLNLFTQLGQRARDASGVTLAVPANNVFQETAAEEAPITPISPILGESQSPQPKIPIPRLRPCVTSPPKSQINLTPVSQPAPLDSQSSSSSPSTPPEPTASTSTTKSGRPKTSHTTIERRYRTNLNARILALRRAVPALRILEKNTTTQTQGKGLTGASATKWDFDDVINERGYVDGVKAAKKNSKGVVLGKAVEYIKALKRREIRLKRESEGLRALLSGLVGGPELLREWEKEWRERFGGDEADEVDEDAEDNEEGDADADDAEDADEGDSDDEDGRTKKRARVEKKERKGKTPPAPQAEKRKRGRPRKNPVLDVPAANTPHLVLQPPGVQGQRQPPKYLLAAFLVFNFFNPNAPTSAPSKRHEGAVLTHGLPVPSTVSPSSEGWTALEAMNILVSVLLLVSLLGAYLPKAITRFLPDAIFFSSPTSSSCSSKTNRRLGSVSPMRDSVISHALASGDDVALRDALGADGSLSSVAGCVGRAILGNLRRVLHLQEKTEGATMRHEDDALRGWRKVSQAEVLRGEAAPLFMKIQAYFSFSSRLPESLVSPSDSITLALLAHSFAASIATEIWERARRSDTKTSSEALVLEMDLEDAAKDIFTSQAPPSDRSDLSPVHYIATHVVLARTKAIATRQFVSSVSGSRVVDLDGETVGNKTACAPSHDVDAKAVVAVGRELGGPLDELTSLLDKVDRCPAAEVLATLLPFDFEIENDSSEESSSESGGSSSSGDAQSENAVKDTRLLLLATLLFRRIFPTENAMELHVPSPSPSPTLKSAELSLALRRALASTAFDGSPDTEDARDRVVDILADSRRARLSGSC